MKVEFSYAPTSGQFEEKQFDLETVWRSAQWCWVKFSSDNQKDWYGTFRGAANKVFYATKLGLVAVLTSDCLYIINPVTKEKVYSDPQTTIQELAVDALGSKFIIADWTDIQYIDADLKVKDAPSNIACDNIKFGGVSNNNLEIEFEEMPDYKIKKGNLNLQTWALEYIE